MGAGTGATLGAGTGTVGAVDDGAGTGTGDTISGVTNNGTESATILWTPTATGTFYDQCSLHGAMIGIITIQQ